MQPLGIATHQTKGSLLATRKAKLADVCVIELPTLRRGHPRQGS